MICRLASLLGLRIPDDLVVSGVGDNLVARFSDPPLTSVSLPGEAVGKAAAVCLGRWLAGGEPPQEDIIVPGAVLAVRESTVGGSGSVALERVRRRVATHAAKGLQIGELVQLADMSVKTLTKHYLAAFGIELAEDIRQRRLARARELLDDGEKTIAEVAAACGFSSHANFYNFFQRHTGDSPSHSRRQNA